LALSFVIVPGAWLQSPTGAAVYENENLEVYGDIRARVEVDWGSQDGAGIERDDRVRYLRLRARVGMSYEPTEHLDAGFRIRSGSRYSQQSPHVSLIQSDDLDAGDVDFTLDKWFLKGHTERLWGWIGRNSLPLWKQNELVWDDDVTPMGVAAGFAGQAGKNGKLAFNSGYFSLPVGMQATSGNMALGQLVYTTEIGEAGLAITAGLLDIDATPEDPDSEDQTDPSGKGLLQGNGKRDYTLWIGSLQGKLKARSLPVVLGLDYLYNSKDYSPLDADPFTAANWDQTDGYVFSIRVGSKTEKGDWLAAYYFARIETFAVMNSYAQDDWVRWGSVTQTRASNMKGHELAFIYLLGKNQNIVTRLYLVEAITTVEDGNRFRVDWNYEF
jgi:hypothetical protein